MLNRFIKLVVSAFIFVFRKIIGGVLQLFSKKSSDTFVIVSYHSVKPHQRQKFAKQMDQVVRVGRPVFADMEKGANKGTHYIAVTFDDGFRNFIDNALPEMLLRKIPATLFITTGYLGKTPDWIKKPYHENAGELLMSADQLKALPYGMVKIGSHCVTHPKLTSLNKEQIISELSESKKCLESLLERNITTLAFPYDDYNEEVIGLAREAGYLHVFKDLPTYTISITDNFLLGRISVSSEDWGIEYFLKLKGAYQWLPFAVKIKHLFMRKTTS
jgi:peptidoglycan/xylan/chitin deacetylase (PgdA/CDA1 family)